MVLLFSWPKASLKRVISLKTPPENLHLFKSNRAFSNEIVIIFPTMEVLRKYLVCLVCLMLNVPVSNFLTRVELEPPTSESGVRGVNHQATAPPLTRE